MRGAVPNGVEAPWGETRVIESPACHAKRHWPAAGRSRRRRPSSKPSSVPRLMLPPTKGIALRSASRMPRTSTPPLPVLRGGQRLALDQRDREPDAGDLLQPLGDHLVIVERAVDRRREDMAVHADDLLQQLLAEAVHHRHHDDQRRDAEQDAEEGEAGDDRDEALAPARAQVAPGQQPFEAGEGTRAGRRCARGVRSAIGSPRRSSPCAHADAWEAVERRRRARRARARRWRGA